MTASVDMAPKSRVLCVDLDGTLLKTDMLHESFVATIKRHPALLLRLPFYALRGRAQLKELLAHAYQFDAAVLPYRQEVVDFIRAERERGRKVVLATASHQKIAEKIAEHLGCFDEVLASSKTVNLKGKNKADALVAAYGEGGFSYIGDSSADRAVWKKSADALVVGAASTAGELPAHIPVTVIGNKPAASLTTLLKALRVHQWVKNLLLFLPLVLAHKLHDAEALWFAAISFIAFSLCSSSVYVLNDLLDLEADRHHHSKRRRPFASGALSIATGLSVLPLLLMASALFALFLPPLFVAVLATYLLLTFLYSVKLKQVVLVDILTLAALYTIRIIAGGEAVQVVVSEWLLGFSMFFFLSLACVKRYSELWVLRQSNKQEVRGRGYVAHDLELIGQLGAAAGYLSVLVMALYISSQEVTALYTTPRVLWLLCPMLLYWVSRVWLLAHRGQLHEDPIVFAIRDVTSYGVGALAALVLYLAI